MSSLRAGIVGVAGYTGAELVRLISAHPNLELCWVAGHSTAGQRLGDALPSVRGLPGVGSLQISRLALETVHDVATQIDVAFMGLPHGEGVALTAALFRAGVQVVDLSADFRLDDVNLHETWYGPHAEPELLQTARYGLVEWRRETLAGARLIAAPGCYPTSAVLALGPVLQQRLVEPDGLIVDSKSGVSGAGRKPSASSHLPESAEGIRPYKVAGAHRHTAEIEQELSRIAGQPVRVVFTPQLAPFSRGILTCAYARARDGVTAEQCREAARQHYGQGLVTVLDEPLLPDTLWVRGSARALVAYALDERTRTLLCFCALDNLGKGAAAQAVQALNVARGWDEALGLPLIAQFP